MLSQQLGLVLVLDEAQVLTSFIQVHEDKELTIGDPIRAFLKDLFLMPLKSNFKLVIAGSENLLLWHTIATTAPNGTSMPAYANRICLPSEHNTALLSMMGVLLSERGYKRIPDSSFPYWDFIKTAALITEVTKIAYWNVYSLEQAFERMKHEIVSEYNRSLSAYLWCLWIEQKEVVEEILDIAIGPKIVKSMNDLIIIQEFILFDPLKDLLDVTPLGDSLSISFKKSFFNSYLQEVASSPISNLEKLIAYHPRLVYDRFAIIKALQKYLDIPLKERKSHYQKNAVIYETMEKLFEEAESDSVFCFQDAILNLLNQQANCGERLEILLTLEENIQDDDGPIRLIIKDELEQYLAIKRVEQKKYGRNRANHRFHPEAFYLRLFRNCLAHLEKAQPEGSAPNEDVLYEAIIPKLASILRIVNEPELYSEYALCNRMN